MAGVERRKVLAIASGGGHWQQLMRLRPALDEHSTVYVTTNPDYAPEVPSSPLFVVTDANRHQPGNLLLSAVQILFRLLRERPDIVISTGAAPGLFGVVLGRLVGAKTIWIDSIANAEVVSLSGRIALRFANVVLTQWPHLASPTGPQYQGSIL